ncbi:MAG: FtsW/RodA/SpoVE family cell cycle protein, partial [Lachnospiraceae bacterium]|nr:FtsW/RodA/SpoVE family cell cycle protein [Lachnospiraceae bacterium]
YRWLKIGPLTLQVSELAKIALIILLADFFSRYKDEINKFRNLAFATVVAAIPTFLIMIQTDLSSSVVMLFIFVTMFYAAGLSYKIIGVVTVVGVPAFVGLLWYVQQPWQKLLSTKQQERILGFLDPETYAKSYMYQQNQSVAAISSGGLLGKFLERVKPMAGLSSKVYVNESDFIFSVAGEVLGFLGCLIVILLLAGVIIRCIMIARNARDRLGFLMAIGISAMFMFQCFVNIGVATSLLPNTGLPLPFLSYGLSSMISSMIAIGLILNIGLQQER